MRHRCVLILVSTMCLAAGACGQGTDEQLVGQPISQEAATAGPAGADAGAHRDGGQLFSYTALPHSDSFVVFESVAQMRDHVASAVFVKLAGVRSGDPGGELAAVEPATVLADFEVLDVLGGRAEPTRSPDFDHPRGITVVLPVEGGDPQQLAAELDGLAGASYLLFLGEDARSSQGGDQERSPNYRLWPDPVAVFAENPDGHFHRVRLGDEAHRAAEQRGSQIDDTRVMPVHPEDPTEPASEPFAEIVGHTRAEILDALAQPPGEPTTPLPANMVEVEPSGFPTIDS